MLHASYNKLVRSFLDVMLELTGLQETGVSNKDQQETENMWNTPVSLSLLTSSLTLQSSCKSLPLSHLSRSLSQSPSCGEC